MAQIFKDPTKEIHILAGRSGKNTRIQNRSELQVSLPFYFHSSILQPELEVVGNVEVSTVMHRSEAL